jgi:hypothetical protein
MTTTYKTYSEAQSVLRLWIAQGKAKNQQRSGYVADELAGDNDFGFKIHGRQGSTTFCVNREDVK